MIDSETKNVKNMIQSSIQIISFDSLGYYVIKESDIPESILAFTAINHGIKDMETFSKWHLFLRNQTGSIKFCPIYNNFTKDVSLHPRKEMVEKSFLEVIPGGRWTPVDCTPQIKGRCTCYVKVKTGSLKTNFTIIFEY